MNNEINHESDSSDDSDGELVNGFFGVADEKINSDSDCIMEADDNAIISKSINFNDPGTTSFATISENYKKSIKDDVIVNLEESTNCNQELEVDSKFIVVLPNGNLPSTLSMITRNYEDSDSDDSSSSSSSEDSSNSADTESDNSDNEGSITSISSDITSKDENNVKTKGELDIKDLPPIENLKISVDANKCEPIGCITNIVETLVVVEAHLNQPALDIDSILFVNRGRQALGKIFDVFGPVKRPFYAIRFNSLDHINEFNIKIDDPIYFAPQTEYVSFVFISKLLTMKGSDASWKNNNEPPPEFLDFSDDEAEKRAKKKRKKKKNINRVDVQNTNENKSPNKSNVTNSPSISNTPNLPTLYSNRPQQYSPNQSNYGYGTRPFPTYAQQLSSVEYSHNQRHPWSYNQRYHQPLQHLGYPRFQDPYNMPPRFDFQTPPPQLMNHNYQHGSPYNYPDPNFSGNN